MQNIVLGLGSNLGDRLENIYKAIALIEQNIFTTKAIRSSIYETKAFLKEGSPREWDINFYNMAIRGKTNLTPSQIITKIQNLESQIGRKKHKKWSPRVIDIDILAYEDYVIDTKKINLPHNELLNRKWCVIPFVEIYDDWFYPVPGPYHFKTIKELSNLLIFNDEYFSKIKG